MPMPSEARRATNRRYYQKHQEQILTYRKQHSAEKKVYDEAYRKTYQQLPHVKARKAQRQKAWRAKYPERSKAYRKKYYDADPEAHRARGRAYYHAHPEESKAKHRNYIRANPEKNATYVQQRRSRKLAVKSTLTHAQWLLIQEHQKHCCYYCGKRSKGRLTQDHIIPLSKGGEHTLHNIIGACKSCNSKKHTGPPPIPVQPLLL
jgi:5-methylcytosine-specific restriction endonuclease McrA